MKTVRNLRNKEFGFLLITLSVLMPLLFILGGSLVAYSIVDIRSASRSEDSTRGFYLAEAAIDQGYRWLRDQAGPPGGTQPLVINGGWQQLNNGSGTFLVAVDPDDNNPNSYIKRYTIQGWGVSDATGALRQTEMVVQVESFARYAYFTNSEISSSGQVVWFRTGDHIEGPIHSNGRFSMYGKPTFDGQVTSVSPTINYYNPAPPGGNAPNFNGGLQLGADPKPYPKVISSALISAATSAGRVFQGNTTVTLVSNGTMKVTNSIAHLTNATLSLPANGVLYVKSGSVNLQGTLHGQLTVAASGDIKVTNSITYADNPQTNPESTDLLGVVAAGNVVVASTAPYNVTIDGSIMALNTSFTVQNWSTGPHKGTLTVNGGIMQAKRGPVGAMNGATGQMVAGYLKDYHYDSRLRTMIPPYFPLTGDYVFIGWDEEDGQPPIGPG